MVEKSVKCIKYLMFFFNFIFWLSGIALIVVGSIIKSKYGDYFSYADSKFATAPIFIIVVGVIVCFIGFLGCCGAWKENYCMVTTFAVILGIIFLLEIVAGALGFAYKKKVQEKAKLSLDRAVGNYYVEAGAKDLLDFVQQKFHCCGRNSSDEYPKSKNGTCPKGGVPSCYKGNTCGAVTAMFTQGCQQSFTEFIQNNLAYVGAVAIGIAFIQLLGIIFACCMMKAIQGGYEVV